MADSVLNTDTVSKLFAKYEDGVGPLVGINVLGNENLFSAGLASERPTLAAMLEELEDKFHRRNALHPTGGEGWSFLNMCNNRRGHQWTGLHMVMAQLHVMAMAVGMGGYVFPQDMWPALPGGMPYVWFDTQAGEEVKA